MEKVVSIFLSNFKNLTMNLIFKDRAFLIILFLLYLLFLLSLFSNILTEGHLF